MYPEINDLFFKWRFTFFFSIIIDFNWGFLKTNIFDKPQFHEDPSNERFIGL